MAYGVQISQFLTGGDALLGDQVAGIRTVGGALNDYKINYPGTGIRDAAGNYMLRWLPGTGTNTNYALFISAPSGFAPLLQSVGGDTNVNLQIGNQGSGYTQINGTGALAIPSGSSGQRPAGPLIGGVRYNSDIDVVEYWSENNGSWQEMGGTTYVNINTRVAAYSLQLTDAGGIVEMNTAGAANLTIPANATVAFPIGTVVDITQYGPGATTIVAGGGVTIRSVGGAVSLNGQYAGATIYKRGLNEWVLIGNLI